MGSSSVKRLPRPGALCTSISPPSSRASRRQIVSPSPVPPNWRVVEVSAWENGLKARATCSGVMPTPVSSTWKRNIGSWPGASSRHTMMRTWPTMVNFTALPTRFSRIWRSRVGSLRIVRGSGISNVTSNASFFSWARGRTNDVTSPTTRHGSHSTDSTVIRPASIFDRSRMSLITASRCSPLRRIALMESRRSLAVRSKSSSRSACPMIAAIGVRISWLMFARNSLLVRLAASAAALARASSSSARFRSVTSSATPATR